MTCYQDSRTQNEDSINSGKKQYNKTAFYPATKRHINPRIQNEKTRERMHKVGREKILAGSVIIISGEKLFVQLLIPIPTDVSWMPIVCTKYTVPIFNTKVRYAIKIRAWSNSRRTVST